MSRSPFDPPKTLGDEIEQSYLGENGVYTGNSLSNATAYEKYQRNKNVFKATSSSGGGTQSGKKGEGLQALIIWSLVLIAVETYVNFTGYLTTNPQRFGVFIASVGSILVIYRYWELILKVVLGLVALAALGGLIYDFFRTK